MLAPAFILTCGNECVICASLQILPFPTVFIHSSNLLSHKHLRSQICDNCTAEPVAVLCATDNLALARTVRRMPMAAASSPLPLIATLWKVSLAAPQNLSSLLSWISIWRRSNRVIVPLDPRIWSCRCKSSVLEMMVPFQGVSCGEMVKNQSSSGGKRKHVIFKQLVRLMNMDAKGKDTGGSGGGVDCGENLVTEVEAKGFAVVPQEGNVQQHTKPFLTLLMTAEEQSHRHVGCDVGWNYNANGPRT